MAAFTGTLNTNEFYNGLFNAYRLITTFADGLSGLRNTLAEKFRYDGGAYHDKSVWTDTDILKSRVWDPTDTNVLTVEQKAEPVQQEIAVSLMRQIGLNTDEYLSKRAWMEPGAFTSFNSVVQAQVGNTKKVYEQRMVNTAVGTTVAAMPSGKGSGQAQNVPIAAADDESKRVRKIGRKIADVLIEVNDTTRDFNDYGFMKAYDKSDLMIVWNAAYLNEFEIMDLPVIFHDQNIITFDGEKLPGRYFGTKITTSNYSTYSASTPTAGKPIDSDDGTYVPGVGNANGTLRALEEQDITVSGTTTHVFPGDELPSGAVVYSSSAVQIPCYIEDPKIICKIMHKESFKYLSGFETSTEFYNAKNLSKNRYLTWMYAYPDYLRNYPLITFKETLAS